MERVNRINYKTIYDFQEAILAGEYDFYDRYDNMKELLVVGSSNAGKSTLINALYGGGKFGQKKAVKVGKRKGKTQTLDFLLVDPDKKHGFIVDSPGYGYTRVPIQIKYKWRRMLFKYVAYGVRLYKIYMLINSHTGMK